MGSASLLLSGRVQVLQKVNCTGRASSLHAARGPTARVRAVGRQVAATFRQIRNRVPRCPLIGAIRA
jgi:hypothetical protein